MICLAASTIAIEPENAERLPPVRNVEAERAGVADDRPHLVVGDAELVGGHFASEARRPPMSGVPAIQHTVPSSLIVSEAHVSPPMLNQKPEATPRPCHFRSGVFQCSVFLMELSVSSSRWARTSAVGGLGALARRVHHAQLDRVEAELLGDLVHHALDGELRDGRAGRPVGGHLRPVGHDVVADDLHVLDVVGA